MGFKQSQYKAALQEPWNLVALSTFGAWFLATMNPLAFIVGGILEAAYLLTFPDTSYYQGVLEQRAREGADKESEQARQSLLLRANYLAGDRREKLRRLITIYDNLMKDIIGQDADVYSDSLKKMFDCLESYASFAKKESEFTIHLVSLRSEAELQARQASGKSKSKSSQEPSGEDAADANSEQWVQETVASISANYLKVVDALTAQVNSRDQSDPIVVVLRQRLLVAQKRAELIKRSGSILLSLRQQMELLEETFGLLNDQMRARQPGEITGVIENLVYQTQHMTEVLEEFDQFVNVA